VNVVGAEPNSSNEIMISATALTGRINKQKNAMQVERNFFMGTLLPDRTENASAFHFSCLSTVTPEQRPSHFFNLLNSQNIFKQLRHSYDLKSVNKVDNDRHINKPRKIRTSRFHG
jgi:hypothetical protein